MRTSTLLVMSSAVLIVPGGGMMAEADEPTTATAAPSDSGTDVRELPASEMWRPGDPMIEGPPRRGSHARDESADSPSPFPGSPPDRPAGAAGACGKSRGAVIE